jgi:TonB family protein
MTTKKKAMIRITNILSIYFLIASLAIACAKSNEGLSHKDVVQSRLKDTLGVAQFPGGVEAMKKYIKENLNWRQNSLTIVGTVLVSCIVTQKGELKGIKVEKSLCDSCDTAAVQVIKTMPNWVPVTKNGKLIESRVLIAVRFGLYSDE